MQFLKESFPELLSYRQNGPRVENFKRILSSLQNYCSKEIRIIRPSLISYYSQKYGIDQFDLYLSSGQNPESFEHYCRQKVNVYPSIVYSVPSTTFRSYYDALCKIEFNTPFVPRTTVELQLQLKLKAALHNKNYSFNRTLISSAGTSRISTYLCYGVISFEQLMTYFSKLKFSQYHRQLSWILYCKIKNRKIASWTVGSLTLIQLQKCRSWLLADDISCNSDNISFWMRQYSEKLLRGQLISNRARLMLSAYFIRELNIDWHYGQLLWRFLLIDYQPSVNRYNWYAQSRNRFLRFYNFKKQITEHSKDPLFNL